MFEELQALFSPRPSKVNVYFLSQTLSFCEELNENWPRKKDPNLRMQAAFLLRRSFSRLFDQDFQLSPQKKDRIDLNPEIAVLPKFKARKRCVALISEICLVSNYSLLPLTIISFQPYKATLCSDGESARNEK